MQYHHRKAGSHPGGIHCCAETSLCRYHACCLLNAYRLFSSNTKRNTPCERVFQAVAASKVAVTSPPSTTMALPAVKRRPRQPHSHRPSRCHRLCPSTSRSAPPLSSLQLALSFS